MASYELTVHLLELDQERHVTGLFGPEIDQVLTRMDERIGHIIEATKVAGTYNDTTFIILGDHGGADFTHIVYLNTYFYENGFIEADSYSKITAWQVYANSCGGSVQIHINQSVTPEQRSQIDLAIEKLCSGSDSVIKHSYTTAQVHDLFELDGEFTYVLEANDGYIFRNDITDLVVKDRTHVIGSYNLDHGHDPNHPNLKTLFMAKGVGIRKGASIPHSCIIDGGPTMAKLLGLKMSHVDGRILGELLSY
jgi:predicted AlkP superfamily pyrophosphatase or phosphodiesterase